MHVVKGDYDETNLPLSITVAHNQIRIGLVHGHQSIPWGDLDALSGVARTLDVDVLISGHTHKFSAQEHEGRYFINPGSATGAWHGTSTEEPTPSFALMDIQGTVIVTYVYQLVDGEVRVEKMEYRKPADGLQPGGASRNSAAGNGGVNAAGNGAGAGAGAGGGGSATPWS